MKYVMLVPDGAADYPLAELGERTPLEAASTPNMDRLAKNGMVGLVKTIPDGMGAGSDVASLSLLGYDPRRYYTGRGPLEAAYRGVALGVDDVAFRCNLITVGDGRLKDYSAGHISTEEAAELIKVVNGALGSERVEFYPGVSYRHLMIMRGDGAAEAQCTPPHDAIDLPFAEHMPKGEGSSALTKLMLDSQTVLAEHPVNKKRVAEGKNPANMIWLWGQGRRPRLPTFKDRFNLTGSVISAVDVIKGIGHYAGLTIVEVPGATGYLDTNYEGKAQSALDALAHDDFVFVHVEATDEAGHEGNIKAKVKAVEDFDQRLVGPIMAGIEGRDCRVLVSPDHATPLALKTHTTDPVPFLIYASSGAGAGAATTFNEVSAKPGRYLPDGFRLIDLLIGG